MGVHVLYITTQNQNLHTSWARQASQESRKVDEQALSGWGVFKGGTWMILYTQTLQQFSAAMSIAPIVVIL